MKQCKSFEDVAATGVIGAAVKRTIGAVTKDEVAAASRAFAGSDCDIASLFVGADVADMLFTRSFGVVVGFNEAAVDAYNLGLGKAFIFELVDYPWYLIPVNDGSGCLDPETALPGECDYGNERDVAKFFEEMFQCTDVPFILMDWVSQGVFVSVDVLCPVFAVLASIYPALVKFGLDDEYTVYGYDYMVNLRGTPRLRPQ